MKKTLLILMIGISAIILGYRLGALSIIDISVISSIAFLIFIIDWMISMKKITKANVEYTLTQTLLMSSYLKDKGFDHDIQKINTDAGNQINNGIDFNGSSDKGFKL